MVFRLLGNTCALALRRNTAFYCLFVENGIDNGFLIVVGVELCTQLVCDVCQFGNILS